MKVRALKPADWPRVKDIYEMGIATNIATFEDQVAAWEAWDSGHLSFGRLVVETGKKVIGWVVLSPVSDRCVYGGVAEVSIYVDPQWMRKGAGTMLMESVIEESEANGIWTLNAGVFPENTGSLNLLKKSGFREIGIREKIGKKKGVWKDNVILERRSHLKRYN